MFTKTWNAYHKYNRITVPFKYEQVIPNLLPFLITGFVNAGTKYSFWYVLIGLILSAHVFVFLFKFWYFFLIFMRNCKGNVTLQFAGKNVRRAFSYHKKELFSFKKIKWFTWFSTFMGLSWFFLGIEKL